MGTLKLGIGVFFALLCIAENRPGDMWIAWFAMAGISALCISSWANSALARLGAGAQQPPPQRSAPPAASGTQRTA